MKTVDSKQSVTTTGAAKYLGVSNATIYRMVENNLLNPLKTPGGQRRFDIKELEEYKIKSKEIKAPQNPSIKENLVKEGQTSYQQLNLLDLPNVEDSNSVDSSDELVTESDGVIDPRNKLNDLSGKDWLPETKSFWFQKGLGSKHPHAQIERQHPAPFSFQDVGRLIKFFTKEGQHVLDPFSGVGSTLKAAALLNRIGTGIELSEHWNTLAKERLDYEVSTGEALKHTFITGDCRKELKKMVDDSFDFIVTSPPYWSILNKKADHKVQRDRVNNNLATNYSDSVDDLGNISDYSEFLDILVDQVFVQCGRVLKTSKYMCIIVSDFRNKSEFVSFHSDIIQRLNLKSICNRSRLTLQGVKVLLQNHKSLLPYGYPFAYVENIHHQYILIFKKVEIKKKSKKDMN
ncbi:DNA methyltransferase [Brevibacillus brevis]|uniref:Methyltransferase n=1 Tax=Brevibacillus brevis TaxID=1393 RepID=A0ABY9T5Z2_BREBE|nr:DNA methyltransferase [Brevibacillus brevis]WNC14352.1 DNA methyltransferase [Brevibacillus brevis]